MMEKKVLFCATKDYHFEAFHLPYFKWFKEQGYKVHTAAHGDLNLPFVDKKHVIPIQRSPFKKENIMAYKELKYIIDNNNFQIIHCHTPMGGALGRLAGRKARERDTKMLYTAHGFHFFKGVPILNWLVYYPIEKFLARMTDCLITINNEDFQIAIQRNFRAKEITHILGVGVDTNQYHPVSTNKKTELRLERGYCEEDFLMFYAAEFNKNKNQQLLLRAFSLIKEEVSNARLLLAGDGPLLDECKILAESLGIRNQVDFLGFRKDIDELLKISDLAVASSLREGLPVNIMEAMACGLPIIANENRGHRELVFNGQNGWLIARNDEKSFAEKIIKIAGNRGMRKMLGESSHKMVERKYSAKKILEAKSELYKSYMEDTEERVWGIH
ncbi:MULTISPECIES: glycosyltransferase family 4 protein [unclassified Bacillus (in: firmicutes)]|uniref:glycosyltransferase family 4 protein n=1 Tax=unclassified Bacillus (in: firmicutes) TaxID=185979 RepID=UPI001BEB9B4F|nr:MULTISPECIES: glycosyltransferase family 4 protein [unclassified Bacillus (in: firmicutes)]MBT2616214.1 glycosyltransferase family 4 protein [Bacillus sp. ISL-78]MBT2628990.1 glycosyltransferase family 4 protein [Bacillus sp. ISL-101]